MQSIRKEGVQIMKSNYMNYFKDGKLHQWDEHHNIHTITPVDINEEFCLDKKGMDMFLKFDNPEIKVGKTLQVKSGNVKANIKLSETTLVVPAFEHTHTAKLDLEKLKTAVKYISKKTNTPVPLTGINLANGYINVSDGFACYRVKIESGDCDIIITKPFVDAINAGTGEIEIRCNEQNVATKVNDIVYIGRLIAGQFPNMTRLYSNLGNNNVVVNKNDLIQLLKYSMDSEDKVILSKDRVQISGGTELDAYLELDLNCEIIIPISKLNLVLSTIDNEEIKINYTDSKRPIFFNEEYSVAQIVKE